MTTYHLPAVVLRSEEEHYWTMVAACRARGPLRPREDLPGGGQLTLLGELIEETCSTCLIRWDEAEERGELLVAWVATKGRLWNGPGAVLWQARPQPNRCKKCGRDEELTNFGPQPLAVIVREDRRKGRAPR